MDPLGLRAYKGSIRRRQGPCDPVAVGYPPHPSSPDSGFRRTCRFRPLPFHTRSNEQRNADGIGRAGHADSRCLGPVIRGLRDTRAPQAYSRLGAGRLCSVSDPLPSSRAPFSRPRPSTRCLPAVLVSLGRWRWRWRFNTDSQGPPIPTNRVLSPTPILRLPPLCPHNWAVRFIRFSTPVVGQGHPR